jgi:hypothetical protein
MSKLCCVPQEVVEEMLDASVRVIFGACSMREYMINIYQANLAARPPLPADIEAALGLAKAYLSIERISSPSEEPIYVLARALLKCCGRE